MTGTKERRRGLSWGTLALVVLLNGACSLQPAAVARRPEPAARPAPSAGESTKPGPRISHLGGRQLGAPPGPASPLTPELVEPGWVPAYVDACEPHYSGCQAFHDSFKRPFANISPSGLSTTIALGFAGGIAGRVSSDREIAAPLEWSVRAGFIGLSGEF